MNYIYFDHAATTAMLPEAQTAAVNAFSVYGNPSSVHSVGIAAKKLIENSRKSIAVALNCKPEEIVFSGGGSESNNHAISGCAKLRVRRSKRIITSDSEHPSVALPIASLESDGWEVIRIGTKGGVLDIKALEAALKDGAAFVSIMLANNETGALYDIAAVRRAIDKSGCGALFHCDAVQGFLKTDMRVIAKNCDLASISAHKIGGLKGVGALYCKQAVARNLVPFIRGGGQENGLRSGTENVAGIASFGAACGEYPKFSAHISELYSYAVDKLKEADAGIKLNIPEKHIDTILSLSVPGARSEVILNALDLCGICISAGSACSARKGPSGTLAAFGLEKSEIEGTVRISFGADNTKEEVAFLVEKLAETAKKLVK